MSNASSLGLAQKLIVPPIEGVPAFGSLPDDLRSNLMRADASLSRLPNLDEEQILRLSGMSEERLLTLAPEGLAGYFLDPLSSKFRAYHQTDGPQFEERRESRFHDEAAVFRRMRADISNSVDRQHLADFIRSLEQLSSEVLQEPSRIRDIPIYHASDEMGVHLEYIAPEAIPLQLSELLKIAGDRASSATYRAAVAYVFIIGTHPFADGNGRIARLLANCVLWSGGMSSESYLPIEEFFRIGKANISIKTRRAIFHRRWDSLIGYFVAMILTMADELFLRKLSNRYSSQVCIEHEA